MIGILRWVIELGRIDITYEISVMSWYLVQPSTGHLVQVVHMFKYLDFLKDCYLEFNPAISEFSDPLTIDRKLRHTKKMYPDAVRYFTPKALPPRGNPIQVSCSIYIDHAGDNITCRSQSGIILYCNKSPIFWYSNSQDNVKSSKLGY